MDKLVAFFKNVWFKRGVAVICWAYTGLMIWVTWLTFAYFFVYENATSLFVLYLFINIAALGLMIYTRKQVITMLNCMILPIIIFALVIFGYGNWYVIGPPLVVMIAMFFINTANETLKTVLGTMYLLMYVIGVAAYIAINMLMGSLTFTGVDLSTRDVWYEEQASNTSISEEYRIVRYLGKPSSEHRIAKYYIEYTQDDVELPFAYCKKVFGCKHALSMQYTGQGDMPIKWTVGEVNGEKVDMIIVEGSLRENPYLLTEIESTETAETAETAETITIGETAETAESAEAQTADATAEAA